MNEKKKKIMVVEDDIFVMDIYKTKLSEEGYEVIAAENGMEALRKVNEENIKPDLIMLDILMPYMDGLSFLKEVRKKEEFKTTPVILLTNLSQKEEIQQGFELGAQDFIIKSHFTPSEVMEKIKQFL